MNTSLLHLPEEKQQELAEIVKAAIGIAKPQMLILFGSYARGNWVYDVNRPDPEGYTTSYISDYDILVVTEPQRGLGKLEGKLQNKLNKYVSPIIPVTPIVHDIVSLNKELEEGNFFFTDIMKDGILLYDTGNYQLAEPKILSPAEKTGRANAYFKKWYNSAGSYLKLYPNALNNGDLDTAAFLMHQATERYFSTILLVFTGDKPRLHDLYKLKKMIRAIDERFEAAFPLNTEEEKAFFRKLNSAYIDSRYKMNFQISDEELKYFSERIQLLQQLTEQICMERIERYKKGEA